MDPKRNIPSGRIERLEKELYSRNEVPVVNNPKPAFGERDLNVPTSWGQPKTFDYTIDPMARRQSNSFFNKFFLVSSIVFLGALSIALYIFFGGVNMISSNNLDVSIIAPSSISSGEELVIGLTIINENRADLDGVTLFVDYPEGSQEIGSEKNLLHDRIDLGSIKRGSSKEYSLRSTVFGEKDELKDYKFKIEYRVKGSNATFSKEKNYTVSIASAPILMNVSYPKEINSGQEVKFKINFTSNSSVVLKNTLVKIDYPYGFTYKTSSIKPLSNNSVWNIGDMADGDKKVLEMTGVLFGQNQEDKTFRITVGTQSKDTSKDFEADLVDQDATIGIRKSFFGLTLSSGDQGKLRIGNSSSVYIKWQNTLPDKVLNARITATVSGNAFDRSKVNVGNNGYYRSIDNTVVWDKNSSGNLGQLLPGDQGEFSFGIGSLSDSAQIKLLKNPHIDVHVVMTGDRSSSDGETISSESDLELRILSTVNFVSKSLRNTGPFSNTGPLPPRADKESTYTVTWTVTNTTNDISNASVVAKLPIGVFWKNEISPASEKVNFDPDTRIVTWNIGNISSGAGFTSSPESVSFKVGIMPSLSQIRSAPELVSQANFTGKDVYVDVPTTVTAGAVTTYTSDPGFSTSDAEVLP